MDNPTFQAAIGCLTSVKTHTNAAIDTVAPVLRTGKAHLGQTYDRLVGLFEKEEADVEEFEDRHKSANELKEYFIG